MSQNKKLILIPIISLFLWASLWVGTSNAQPLSWLWWTDDTYLYPSDSSWIVSSDQFRSTVATGTAPLIIASTTVVPNLNVDQVDGLDTTDFLLVTGVQNSIGVQTFNEGIIIPEDKNIFLGAAGLGILSISSSNTVSLANLVTDGDLAFQISDGGSVETITWDADVNKLKHSGGTFDFDNDNLLTTGTVGAGAITGTSFIIGGNTLDTNEWAYLDGQDQAIKTTSDPTFDDITVDKATFNETASFDAEFDNGNSSTADTIDWGVGNKQKSTLTGDVTYTFTDPAGACNLVFRTVQDGTGGRSITWDGDVDWAAGVAPASSSGAADVDVYNFYYDGATYHGVLVVRNSS